MNGIRWKRWRWLGLLLAAALAGCSSGDKSLQISGTVRFQEQPVPAGLIYFNPDAAQKFDAPQGFARIKDGRFSTAHEGRGILPGPYVVRVLIYDGKPAKGAPQGQPLRAPYEEKVSLSADRTTVNFDIPREQDAEKE